MNHNKQPNKQPSLSGFSPLTGWGLHRFFWKFQHELLEARPIKWSTFNHLFSHWSIPFKFLTNSIHLEITTKKEKLHTFAIYFCRQVMITSTFMTQVRWSNLRKVVSDSLVQVGESTPRYHSLLSGIPLQQTKKVLMFNAQVKTFFYKFTQSSVNKGISLIEEHIAVHKPAPVGTFLNIY